MATTSWVKPNDGPPISSQDRLIPTRKQTTTTIAIVSTASASSGRLSRSTPSRTWITNSTVSPTRNRASRIVLQRTWRSRTSDSSDAATNKMPLPPAATAAGPIVCPGIKANSDTASALRNAVSAAAARMR
jgi:hypothetical protein